MCLSVLRRRAYGDRVAAPYGTALLVEGPADRLRPFGVFDLVDRSWASRRPLGTELKATYSPNSAKYDSSDVLMTEIIILGSDATDAPPNLRKLGTAIATSKMRVVPVLATASHRTHLLAVPDALGVRSSIHAARKINAGSVGAKQTRKSTAEVSPPASIF